MKLAGEDGFNAAEAGEGDGFAGADFVEAGEKFLQLADMHPFQEGFQACDLRPVDRAISATARPRCI